MSKDLFREDNKKITQLMFAAQLLVKCERIAERELIDILKSLRKSHQKKLRKASNTYEAGEGIGIITTPEPGSAIMLRKSRCQYNELAHFNKEDFNSLSRAIIDFYIDTKKVDYSDIKLIGKVYLYEFDLDKNAIKALQESCGLYEKLKLSNFETRATIKKDNMNIHLYVSAKSEDDLPDHKNIVSVRLDINNANQFDGLDENSFNEIFNYCDSYAKDELLGFLNANYN